MRIHSDRQCRSSSAGHTKLHHITTNYRWLEVIENMEVVLKAVPFASCPQLSQDASEGNVPTLQGSSLIIN